MDDIIYRKKALSDLREIREMLVAGGDPILASVLERAIKCVEQQPKANNWTPKESPPPIGAEVLVAIKMKYAADLEYEYEVDQGCFHGDGEWETWNDWYEGQEYFEITHWAPKPEPPKEETT